MILNRNIEAKDYIAKAWRCDRRHKVGTVGAEPHHYAVSSVTVVTIRGFEYQ